MAKRMIIMLLLVGGFVAAIGTLKYHADPRGDREGRRPTSRRRRR